jgi:hypothetical protein
MELQPNALSSMTLDDGESSVSSFGRFNIVVYTSIQIGMAERSVVPEGNQTITTAFSIYS